MIEYTDEFGTWYAGLSEREQEDITAIVGLLDERGQRLPFPLFFRGRGIETRPYARIAGAERREAHPDLLRF